VHEYFKVGTIWELNPKTQNDSELIHILITVSLLSVSSLPRPFLLRLLVHFLLPLSVPNKYGNGR
jgi:hypothetical protein